MTLGHARYQSAKTIKQSIALLVVLATSPFPSSLLATSLLTRLIFIHLAHQEVIAIPDWVADLGFATITVTDKARNPIVTISRLEITR